MAQTRILIIQLTKEHIAIMKRARVSLRWCYLEEYHQCGCSFIAAKKRDLMGYCSRHGNDRKRVTKLPDKYSQHGYAG